MNKNIVAASWGTLIEWAEFSFYAYLAIHFAKLFFPELSHTAGIMASFGVFAASFLARPVGAIIFGHIGDRQGRKKALSYSMLLMGVSTLGIGLLPTYVSIGIAAPILLILLRLIQGMAVAGEFTGAAIFIVEHDKSRKYFSSSWVSTFSAAGMLLGSLMAMVISLPGMPTWAWRVPFYLGFVAALFGVYIRHKLSETMDFKQLVKTKKLERLPLLSAIKHHPKMILKTACLALFVGVYIYVCNVWWTSYVIQKHYFTMVRAEWLASCGQIAVVIFTPLMAVIADKIGGHLIMRSGLVLAGFAALLIFWVAPFGHFSYSLSAVILYGFANACVTACMFLYMTKLLPTASRYSGQAVTWNLTVAIFGGTAPLMAQYLLGINNMLPAVLVLVTVVVAFVSVPQKRKVFAPQAT